MAGTVELPDDLLQDLEQEVARWQMPPAEIIRQALHAWKAGRHPPAGDREQVKRLLQERGLLCELPATLTEQARPLATEELDELSRRAAQGGPVSALIIKERRGEQ
jgi:hypothetical protein